MIQQKLTEGLNLPAKFQREIMVRPIDLIIGESERAWRRGRLNMYVHTCVRGPLVDSSTGRSYASRNLEAGRVKRGRRARRVANCSKFVSLYGTDCWLFHEQVVRQHGTDTGVETGENSCSVEPRGNSFG